MIKFCSSVVTTMLCVMAISTFAYAEMTPIQERDAVISSATKLYPRYINELYPASVGEDGKFVNLTRDAVFHNAIVIKLSSGYILYNPMNGIVFVFVGDTNRPISLVGIPPSQLFSIAGKPALNESEFVLSVSLLRIPEAMLALREKLFALDAGQLISVLTPADAQMASYEAESVRFFLSGYVRAATFADCLDDIDLKSFQDRVQVDLLRAGMSAYVGKKFEYVDFVKISAEEGIVVHTAKDDGVLYAVSRVSMGKPCRIAETQYKML